MFNSDYEIGKDVSQPDAIIVRSAKMHDMELPDTLTAVARAGAGYNNIPVDKCSQQGIVVFNTPGANANAVKELVIAGMLLAGRDIIGGAEWARTLKGQGDKVGALVEKGKGQFVGPELKGKKLAVIGLGAIGTMVANTAAHSTWTCTAMTRSCRSNTRCSCRARCMSSTLISCWPAPT